MPYHPYMPMIPFGPMGSELPWGYNSVIPVGAVLPFAGKICDVDQSGEAETPIERWGWMFCDGRSLKISDYPELFAVLGKRYNASNSDTEFNLPDYRGMFMRGVDEGAGKDPDSGERKDAAGSTSAEVGSIQEDALQKHEHIYKAAPSATSSAPPPTSSGAPAAQPTLTEGGPTDSLGGPIDVRVSEKETRPVNVYVYFIIKYSYGSRRYDHVSHR